MNRESRGVGMAFLCLLTGARGVFGLLQSTAVMALGAVLGGAGGLLAIALGGLLLLLSFVQLLAAGGLWAGHGWAWYAAVGVFAFDLLVGATLVFAGGVGTGTVVAAVVDLAALAYLSAVKSRFGSDTDDRREIVPGA